MSDYQHKPNSGSLFKNDKKQSETDPNAKGSALVDGIEYWISAWTNTAKDGSRYQSIKFTPKQEVHEKGMAQAQAEFQDDIPF